MISPDTSLQPRHVTQLVLHLQELGSRRREKMAELYGAHSAEPFGLAEYVLREPGRIVEVVADRIDSSLGWRIIGEAVMQHDMGVPIDWAPSRQRDQVARLGLIATDRDEGGRIQAKMPGALAAIFADRVRGQRASLPVLLGRAEEVSLRRLAKRWGLGDEGSKIQVLLRICDHYERGEMVNEMLDEFATPDWIGDALMVLELGGMCYWHQIFGYDLDEHLGAGENVVPLMRSEDRSRQREVAEALLEIGLLFRFEHQDLPAPMVAVPEELWHGLWTLGRRWLLDWTVQAIGSLRERAMGKGEIPQGRELKRVLKWWLCEAGAAQLSYDQNGEGLAPECLRRLGEVHSGEVDFNWNDLWYLGRELRVLDEEPYGMIGKGPEAKSLLDRKPPRFVAECLLEWCLGYSGKRVDEHLPAALGLDETWRGRALSLMRRQVEPVPVWMELEGVASETTGAGWLREPGTGPEEIVLYEVGLAATFVTLTKVLWLDLISMLESGRKYPRQELSNLMQCLAGFSMFTQLKLALAEQPAPVYLPFQRASFLMDHRHDSFFEQWTDEIVQRLLVPLGVASSFRDGQVSLRTEWLCVEDPPGWPEGERKRLLAEIFGSEIDFEPGGAAAIPEIRQVKLEPVSEQGRVAIDQPLETLLEIARGRRICEFDGEFIRFEE